MNKNKTDVTSMSSILSTCLRSIEHNFYIGNTKFLIIITLCGCNTDYDTLVVLMTVCYQICSNFALNLSIFNRNLFKSTYCKCKYCCYFILAWLKQYFSVFTAITIIVFGQVSNKCAVNQYKRPGHTCNTQ